VWQQALKRAYQGFNVTVLPEISGKLTGLSSFVDTVNAVDIVIVGENKLSNQQLAELESIKRETCAIIHFSGSIQTIHKVQEN